MLPPMAQEEVLLILKLMLLLQKLASMVSSIPVVHFIKNSRITPVAGGFTKNRFGACGMQPAALAARRGVMQQAVLAGCIIFKYLHATEQHFACRPK